MIFLEGEDPTLTSNIFFLRILMNLPTALPKIHQLPVKFSLRYLPNFHSLCILTLISYYINDTVMQNLIEVLRR